jgi:hypothetical protein
MLYQPHEEFIGQFPVKVEFFWYFTLNFIANAGYIAIRVEIWPPA